MARICEVLGQLVGGAGRRGGDPRAGGRAAGRPLPPRLRPGRPARATRCRSSTRSPSLVLSRGRTAYIEDLAQRPDLAVPQPKTGEPFAAVLAAPLRAMGWPVGTLEVYRRTPGPWGDDEVGVVESLAAQASISLEALRQLAAGVAGAAAVRVGAADGAGRHRGRATPTAPTSASTPPARRCSACRPTRTSCQEPDRRGGRRRTTTGRVDAAGAVAAVARGAARAWTCTARSWRSLLPTGRRIALLTNAAPVRDAAGKPTGAVAAFVDITPQKELQRELDTRRREAEEASVRKTRFLAAVSHDIRTPANAITLLAELIRRTASNPALAAEVPELAKELHASAMSLVELLGDVLDLARYDSGRIEMQETRVLARRAARRGAPPLRAAGAREGPGAARRRPPSRRPAARRPHQAVARDRQPRRQRDQVHRPQGEVRRRGRAGDGDGVGAVDPRARHRHRHRRPSTSRTSSTSSSSSITASATATRARAWA